MLLMVPPSLANQTTHSHHGRSRRVQSYSLAYLQSWYKVALHHQSEFMYSSVPYPEGTACYSSLLRQAHTSSPQFEIVHNRGLSVFATREFFLPLALHLHLLWLSWHGLHLRIAILCMYRHSNDIAEDKIDYGVFFHLRGDLEKKQCSPLRGQTTLNFFWWDKGYAPKWYFEVLKWASNSDHRSSKLTLSKELLWVLD